MNKSVFDNLALNDTKYQIKFEKYLIHKKEDDEIVDAYSKDVDELLPHTIVHVPIQEPKITLWEYLPKEELNKFLNLKKKSEIRPFIEDQLASFPKGFPRIIFRELIYSVRKFGKLKKFNLEQIGAILSQFYLTHIYFTSRLKVGAEKLYNYFKDIQLCHSLPFPPNNVKLFNLDEIKCVMIFFCKLYLRNLPIIRFLCLPNISLSVNYELEPESALLSGKKGKKDKKGKKGKKDKKDKKGKKKKK